MADQCLLTILCLVAKVQSHANARKNNPLCPDYIPEIPLNTIMHLDANILYG